MDLSKLQRHVRTSDHASLTSKDKNFFQKSLSAKFKQKKVFEKQLSVSQIASYEIVQSIEVKLKPNNLAEEIRFPACRKIVKIMFDGSTDVNICKMLLSNDTIYLRIKGMS
ncbi:hypothetical protein TNIN_164271 [Trichonephila inaurata madagascariensis]|uniref:Uncharacterized protein n=1 Tax=Trichonephila inaurata madagascariensis TaxID=2747483 RepID=A0A8X6XWH0_9ARAC|nr:hypothetical protein TNIN_164271 [Trichonephila inaurata madagascariensis]